MIVRKEMEKTPPGDELRLLLVGMEKSGKSRLASTGRKPVLFFDFDRRAESLAGIKDVFTMTFTDPKYPNQPDAFSEMLDILTKLEAGASLKDLGFDSDKRPRTLVLDSTSTIAKAAMAYALYTTKSLRREISIGGKMTVHVPFSYDGWNAEMNMVEQAVLRAMAIPGIDLVQTMHESAEEAPDSTDANPKFTGKITVYPVRYKSVLKYFNDIWRVDRSTGSVQIQIVPNYLFPTCGSTLGLTAISEPNIEWAIREARKARGFAANV